MNKLKRKLIQALNRVKCFFGFHEKDASWIRIEVLRKRKYEDATVVREHYCCKHCGKIIGPTGREGTMYELYGHIKPIKGLMR